MDLQQAPLQNSRTCPPPLTQLWPSCCIGISRRLVVTFHLVTKPSHPDQRTGRIHARHHAYHCRRQVRPLRGARSEVSSQTLRRLVPLQSARHEAYIKGPGRFTKEEFEDLCFDFGIELDEDTEEDERPEGVPPELKIGQS